MRGLRSWSIARSSGARIAVYDGLAADLDVDGGRWSTSCETHGSVVAHQTLEAARSFAAAPEEWCEACAELVLGVEPPSWASLDPLGRSEG